MQLSSDAQIPDGLLAAITLLNEKPRLGFRTWENTSYPGFKPTQSTTALRHSWSVASGTRWVSLSCEFGACGSGGMDLTNGQGDSSSSTTYSINYFPPGVLRLPSIHDKPNVSRNSGYCSAYRDGRGIGDGLAFLCGKVFPDGPWSNCVRGKLLQQYVPGDNVAIWGYLFYDHPKDSVTCKVY